LIGRRFKRRDVRVELRINALNSSKQTVIISRALLGGETRGFNALAESAHNVDPRGIGKLPCCDDVALRECESVCEVESVTRCLLRIWGISGE
jgi:hypothetical protein